MNTLLSLAALAFFGLNSAYATSLQLEAEFLEPTHLQAGTLGDDGRTAATLDTGNQLKLWDVASKQLLRTIDARYSGFHLELSHGYIFKTSYFPAEVRVWKQDTGELKYEFKLDNQLPEDPRVDYLDFMVSPDGTKLMVVDGYEEAVYVWGLNSGNRLFKRSFSEFGEFQTFYGGAFSADSSQIAVSFSDVTGVLKSDSGEVLMTLKVEDRNTFGNVAFASDGKILLNGSWSLELWDVNQKAPVWKVTRQKSDGYFDRLSATQNATRFFDVAGKWDADKSLNQVELRSSTNGDLVKGFSIPDQAITLGTSPDGALGLYQTTGEVGVLNLAAADLVRVSLAKAWASGAGFRDGGKKLFIFSRGVEKPGQDFLRVYQITL